MNVEIKIEGKKYFIDFSKYSDLSIPINFNGQQPNTYNVEKASSVTYRDNSFVGD